jgi:hypothetical protein
MYTWHKWMQSIVDHNRQLNRLIQRGDFTGPNSRKQLLFEAECLLVECEVIQIAENAGIRVRKGRSSLTGPQ